jgi:NAD+ kinase
MKVGLVIHTGRDGSLDAAVTAAGLLAERGIDVVAVDQDEHDAGTVGDGPQTPPGAAAGGGEQPHRTDRQAGEAPPAETPPSEALRQRLPAGGPIEVLDPDAFADGLDLALSFGGDGTLLRSAHLCRDAAVPVLGLNFGRLGFLTEVEKDDLGEVVDTLVSGDYAVDERPTLQVEARAPDGEEITTDWALNEVSVEKTARQRILLMALYVGDSFFAEVPADAVVVATPTGSTAYAFSAGGPILSPHVRATLVTPVAPHSVFGRTLVVGEDEQVRVEVLEGQSPAIVSCDGRAPVTVPAGGSILVRGGGEPVRLVRVRPSDFYGLVRAKFGLQ